MDPTTTVTTQDTSLISQSASLEVSQELTTEEAQIPLNDEQKPGDSSKESVYELYSWRSKAPDTRLVYIRDLATAESELAELQPGPLGFDLEWKPNRWRGANNPVALVQLANHNTILLIQVTAIQSFPERLKKVLADPSYLKAGVGIQNDCKKLWADYRVNTRNCVDLCLLARTADNTKWKGKYNQPIGLARLCRAYENLDLSKGRITRSNWESHLDELQQEYAANDCHSGLTLYLRLHGLMSTLEPLPPPGYYSFDFFQGYLYHPSSQDIPSLLWQPHNPNYDPGPEPEKKQKAKRTEKKVQPEGSANGAASDDRLSHFLPASFPVIPQQSPLAAPGPFMPLTGPGPLMVSLGAPIHGSNTQMQIRNLNQQRWNMQLRMPLMHDPSPVFTGSVPTQPPRGRGRGGRGRGRGGSGRGSHGYGNSGGGRYNDYGGGGYGGRGAAPAAR